MKRRAMMSMMTAAALAFGIMASGALAQDANMAANSVLEQVKQRGVLRVGVTPTLPPGAMRAKNGARLADLGGDVGHHGQHRFLEVPEFGAE